MSNLTPLTSALRAGGFNSNLHPIINLINASPVGCTGALKDARTGYLLQDLTVQLYYTEPTLATIGSVHPPTPAPTLLGNATSQANGSFDIDWVDSDAVRQKLQLLNSTPTSLVSIQVTAPNHPDPIYRGDLTQWGSSPIRNFQVSVTIPDTEATADSWTKISASLKPADATTLSKLVKNLAVLPTDVSTLSSLPVTARVAAVSQLERAFLDPDKKLQAIAPLPAWSALASPDGLSDFSDALGDLSTKPDAEAAFSRLRNVVKQFPSISAVDWTIDPTKLTNDLAGAITQNPISWNPHLNGPIFILKDFDLIGYRDYLLAQWKATIEGVGPDPLTDADVMAQLRNRFHQDFTTQATNSAATNEVLVPILTEILTATADSFGFAIATATVPARGSTAARAYLDKLVALSGKTAQELSLRYRTDFSQPDSAISSPVWVNIRTLQAFFSDSFLGTADPKHAKPDNLSQPIIPNFLKNSSPFFLQYDEWLLKEQPIPFENFFQIRNIFFIDINLGDLATVTQWASGTADGQAVFKPLVDWSNIILQALSIQTRFQKAFSYFDQFEYAAASNIMPGLRSDLIKIVSNTLFNTLDITGKFKSRIAQPINSMDDLVTFMKAIQTPPIHPPLTTLQGWMTWQDMWTDVACGLIYALNVTWPWFIAQLALATGDYPKACFYLGASIDFLVSQGSISADQPYKPDGGFKIDYAPYFLGDLPYSVRPHGEGGYPWYDDDGSPYYRPFPLPHYPQGGILSGIEQAFFRLQMGESMLQWADTLYRSDQTASIARARELYKGIYYLHGMTPPINPAWDTLVFNPAVPRNINPVKQSQLARAQRGFIQITGDLNFFGFPRDIVPVLRYSSLKPAADAFTASARSVESEFLNAIQQLESISVESFKNTAMLQHATAQSGISQAQASQAQDQITQANFGVSQVQGQITAKQKEIADHDSFSGQLSDYVGGLLDVWKKIPSSYQTAITGSVAGEAGFSTTSADGLLGLGAGATVMAGFGAFWYASYVTMSSMADAQNGRQGQLAALQSQNLPVAQAQADIAKKSLVVAQLNQQIANADAALAQNLIGFTQLRLLNAEFLSYTAALYARILRQYLDYASRTGWLAERALAYELSTPMGVMKFDYFNTKKQGAGSAEAIQLDLASLEAKHLQAQSEMLPIKYSISMARDFPLQFAQLKTQGTCSFMTSDKQLQAAYPGTYSHRILALQPQMLRTSLATPFRGLLSNSGFSSFTASDGTSSVSARPQDALPISDFQISTTDASLNGLPGAALMPFEGSGINTIWTLQYPRAGNPGGLAGLADVMLTFNIQARFSSSLYQTLTSQPSATVSKTLLVSLSRSTPTQMATVRHGGATPIKITLDKTALPLPAGETARTLNNVFVVLAGDLSGGLTSVKATLASLGAAATSASFVIANGVAVSNAPPVTDAASTVARSPLNVLAGASVSDGFVLTLDTAGVPATAFAGVQDVWIGLDYTAKF